MQINGKLSEALPSSHVYMITRLYLRLYVYINSRERKAVIKSINRVDLKLGIVTIKTM